jgi:hypothetical protein
MFQINHRKTGCVSATAAAFGGESGMILAAAAIIDGICWALFLYWVLS